MADERPESAWALLRRLVPWVRMDLGWYALALLAAPLGTALVVVQPWLIKQAVDGAILKGDAEAVVRVAFAYLGAVVVGFFVEGAYTLAISAGAMRTISRIRRAVYAHTLTLARSYFDRVPTGRLLTRVTSDVEALGETLTAGAVTIVLDVLLVLGVLAAMFALDARLSGLLLLVAPVLALALEGIRRVLRALYVEVRTTLSALNAYMAERITGLSVVQLYRDEARTLSAFDAHLGRYRTATIKTNVWDALLYALVDGVASICAALMLWYAAGGWFGEAATAGLLAAFIDYVGRLFDPIKEFSQKLAVIQRAAAALEKIFGLLDEREQVRAGDRTPDGPHPTLTLEDVRFAYGDGPAVLDGVSLELTPGRTVALVGRTGSGKTTIGKLITRAYQGYSGSIRLGDVELTELDRDALRRTVAVVQQDTQLFPGTVRFNLTLGRPVSDEALREAIRLANAGPTVEKLGGLDGLIAHDGANCSVGEGQLLSFARTLACDTPIVILDEATASVDSLTEAAIQRATEAVLQRRTVLVIAHRLSTIVAADEILVLDHGAVIERGTHAALMAAGGPYAALFAAQFAERTHPDGPRGRPTDATAAGVR